MGLVDRVRIHPATLPGAAAAAAAVALAVSAPPVPTADATGDVGADTHASVRKTILRHAGQLKSCYETRLKVNRQLAGRVEIEWTIRDGLVTATAPGANTTGDPELASCIESRVKGWTFPPEVSGDIHWPFLFKPKK